MKIARKELTPIKGKATGETKFGEVFVTVKQVEKTEPVGEFIKFNGKKSNSPIYSEELIAQQKAEQAARQLAEEKLVANGETLLCVV